VKTNYTMYILLIHMQDKLKIGRWNFWKNGLFMLEISRR
jgi:hypothetical protein